MFCLSLSGIVNDAEYSLKAKSKLNFHYIFRSFFIVIGAKSFLQRNHFFLFLNSTSYFPIKTEKMFNHITTKVYYSFLGFRAFFFIRYWEFPIATHFFFFLKKNRHRVKKKEVCPCNIVYNCDVRRLAFPRVYCV